MTNITLKVRQSMNAAIPAIPPSATTLLLNASRKAALVLESGGALTVVTAAVENGVLENDDTRDVGAVVVAELVLGAVVEGVLDGDDTVGTDVVALHNA